MSFNWIHYKYLNPDLHLKTQEACVRHYRMKGKNEQRKYNIYMEYPDFDYKQYALNYLDLSRFGKGFLENHWLQYGRNTKENRTYKKKEVSIRIEKIKIKEVSIRIEKIKIKEVSDDEVNNDEVSDDVINNINDKIDILYICYHISSFTKSGYTSRTDNIVKNMPNTYVVLNPFIVTNKVFINNTIIKKNNISYILFTKYNLLKLIKFNNINKYILPSNSNNYLTFINNMKTDILKFIENPQFIYEIRGLWYLSRDAKMLYCKKHKISISNKDHTNSVYDETQREISALNDCDKYVFITDEIKNYLLNNYNINNKPFEIIYNAYDTLNNTNIINMNKTNYLNKKFVIGFTGSITAYEWIDGLIEACDSLIKSKKYNIQLTLIGKMDDYLKNTIDLNKNYIIYKEWMEYSDLIKEFELFDLICIPRYPYLVSDLISPLKPFEIMYNKIPLLMSDCETIKSLSSNGKYCRLFKKGNIESLQNEIISIIDNGYSNEMLEEAHNYIINERNWEKQCKKYINFINN